jgi:hypothetical protein
VEASSEHETSEAEHEMEAEQPSTRRAEPEHEMGGSPSGSPSGGGRRELFSKYCSKYCSLSIVLRTMAMFEYLKRVVPLVKITRKQVSHSRVFVHCDTTQQKCKG